MLLDVAMPEACGSTSAWETSSVPAPSPLQPGPPHHPTNPAPITPPPAGCRALLVEQALPGHPLEISRDGRHRSAQRPARSAPPLQLTARSHTTASVRPGQHHAPRCANEISQARPGKPCLPGSPSPGRISPPHFLRRTARRGTEIGISLMRASRSSHVSVFWREAAEAGSRAPGRKTHRCSRCSAASRCRRSM